MPGRSFSGVLGALDSEQASLARELERDVCTLAGEIGERNLDNYSALCAAEHYLERELRSAGYRPQRHALSVQGRTTANIEVELPGNRRRHERVVIGAHYDSVTGTVGANDNATGCAALLALARRMAEARPSRSLRFVAFVNEEPPYSFSSAMGSLAYAKRCHDRRENVVAMLSLETIGYFSDTPGSQLYPPGVGSFFPSVGNFIGFVGNLRSRTLVRRAVGAFRSSIAFPSEGAALPSFIPGVGWSDHWSFWQFGYPAIMVTDTAPFRYPHYHLPSDTPDKVDYERMARVVFGLLGVVRELVD